jgi:broad specificity phosphatase PhoE
MLERLAVAKDTGDARDAEANDMDGIGLGGDAPTRLFLIRHGETGWNVEGRYQGQADPPLNQEGLRQARSLARRLRGRGLDVLYTSPLLRARVTTDIVSDVLHAPVRVDARLMEINLGRWQGRLATDIEREDPELFRRWHAEPWAVRPPEGETLAQVQERVFAAADDILNRCHGQCVGVVTHRIPYLLLGIRYLGFPRDAIVTFKIANACFEEIVNTARGAGAPPDRPRDSHLGGVTTNSRVP